MLSVGCAYDCVLAKLRLAYGLIRFDHYTSRSKIFS